MITHLILKLRIHGETKNDSDDDDFVHPNHTPFTFMNSNKLSIEQKQCERATQLGQNTGGKHMFYSQAKHTSSFNSLTRPHTPHSGKMDWQPFFCSKFDKLHFFLGKLASLLRFLSYPVLQSPLLRKFV